MKLKYLWSKFLKKALNPPALLNCGIDKSAKVCAGSELKKVTVGRYSYIGNRCFGVNAAIGNFCSIADNCRIGGAEHPLNGVSTSPVFFKGKNVLKKNFSTFDCPSAPMTVIENDVWVGAGSLIKSGVTIHNGAVIGMGSVVTHDVPAYEVWAGNPARKIKDRFDDDVKRTIEATRWWDQSDEVIERMAHNFDNAAEFAGKNESK